MGMMMGGLARKPSARKKATGIALALLMVSSMALTSCGGSGNNNGGGGGGGGGGITVSVSPRTASKFPTEQQQFSATVSGTNNTLVAWQVNGITGGNSTVGTIDGSGMYTTPSLVPTPSTVTVSGISQADITKSASATMSIKSPTPSGTYTVTITATVGSVVQTTTAMLVVE
jgi:hypothetical protein